MKRWLGCLGVSMMLIYGSVKGQVLADFETGATTPVLSGTNAAVANNPDKTGNPSDHAAYYRKNAGNWQAIYMNFSAKKNIGKADRLRFLLRSSTQGRVFVKVVNGSTTILEGWAPEYGFRPAPNQWTECILNTSAITDQEFDRIEVNASVDNEAQADVYVDDFKLVNSLSPNGEPVVVLNVSDYEVNTAESIQFDASESFDPDGTIASYAWTFGDGDIASGAVVNHAYSLDGIFKATLTLEDNEGKTATQNFMINVLPATGKLGSISFVTVNPKVYEKTEGIFLVKGSYANVFDPDVVKVDAIITAPGGSMKTVPCFFYRKATYQAGDQWTQVQGGGYWMLRFSASVTGVHQVQLKLTDSEGTTQSTQTPVTISAGDKKGYIRTDANNRQYYRHTTGQPYYPLGINVAWDNTSNYTAIINNLGNGDANLVRYWQVPFDRQGLEWKNGSGFYKGLGVYSQEAAAEQDSIFALCEKNDLYLQMTIFQHGMFSENVNSNWSDNPYNTVNGGPLARAEQYFYNADAKLRTKKLLRYIVARWGYSANLFAWELFNEVNFTGIHGSQTAQWYPAMIAWHDEMGQYIKSLDAFDHPVTTSSDESHLHDMDALQGLDIVQYHLYNTNLLTTQTTKDKTLLNTMTRTGVINGEYGLDVNTADVPFDVQRVSIWTGIMTQVPHLMWKWDNYTNATWSALFEYPAAYVEDEDFVAGGLLSDWVFNANYGAGKLTSVGFKNPGHFYAIIYDIENRNNLTNVTCDFANLPAGNYEIFLHNVLTGEVQTTTAKFYPSQTNVVLPVFSKAIAIKVKFVSAITTPIANAGQDMLTHVSDNVMLSGTASYNPTAESLTYTWTIVEKPALSNTTLAAASTASPHFIPDVPGTYTISLVVSAGAFVSDPDEVIVTVDDVLGIEEPEQFKRIQVYPNPTDNYLRADFASLDTRNLMLQVTDALGRIVMSGRAEKPDLENNVVQVSLREKGLPAGVYVVTFRTTTGSFVRKIVYLCKE